MLPLEDAIIEKLRKTVHAALTMSSRAFPISVGDKYSSPLIACRGTDGCSFANSVTRLIRSHSALGIQNSVQ